MGLEAAVSDHDCADTRARMVRLAQMIDDDLNGDGPPEHGFILLVSRFIDQVDGGVDYICNIELVPASELLREYLARRDAEDSGPAPTGRKQ